jgi:hypothetical protein
MWTCQAFGISFYLGKNLGFIRERGRNGVINLVQSIHHVRVSGTHTGVCLYTQVTTISLATPLDISVTEFMLNLHSSGP